jgi:hypothetical protein
LIYILVNNTNKMLTHTQQQNRHPLYRNYYATADGEIYSIKKYGDDLRIKQANHQRGYYQFGPMIAGKKRMYLSHRFIYECMTGEMIPKGLQINHIDNCKTNNHIDNLELVTQIENMAAGIASGVLYGSANPNHPFYYKQK